MDIYSIIDAAMILEHQGHIESGDEEPSPPPVLIASARVMSALYRSIMSKKQPLIKSTPAQRAAFAQLQQRAIVPFTHIQDYDDYEAIRPQKQKAKPRASTAGPSRAGRQHRKGSWMDITKRMLESEAPIPGGSLSIPHATARITSPLAAPPSAEEGTDADASAPPASKDDDEEYIPDEEEIIPVTRQHHPAHGANDEFVPPPIPKIRPISVALGILPAAAQHGFRYIVSSGDKWRGQVGYNGDSGQRKLYTAYVPSAEQAARDVDQLMYKIRGRAYVPNLPMSDEEKARLDGMTLHEVLATFQGQKNPTGGIALANLRNSRIVAAAIANGESPDLVMSAPPRARSRPRSARASKMDEFTDEDDDEGYGRGRGKGKGKGKGKGRGYGARARVVGITLNTGLVERQLAVAIRAPHGIPDAYKEAMGAMAMEETSAAVAQGASLDQIQAIGAAVTAALTLHQQHKAAIESGLKPEPQIQQMKPLALENGEGAAAGAVAGEGPGGEDDALALASALASALSGEAPPPPAAAAGAEIDPTPAATAHATAHAAQPSDGSSDDLVQALIDLLKPGCLDSQLPPNLTLPGMNVPDSHHLVNSLRDTLRKAIDPSGPSSSIQSLDSSPQTRPPLSSRAHVPLGELMAHHVPKASTMVAVRDEPAEDDIEALYRERPQPPVRQQPLAHVRPAAAQAPAVGAGSRAHLSRRSAVACAKVIANGGFGYCPPSPQAKGREKRAAQDPDFYYQPLPPTVPAVAPATWGVEDSLVATAPAAAGDNQGGGAEGMRKKARKAVRPAPAAEGGGFGSSLNDPADVPPAPASVGRGAAMTRARPTRAPGSGSGGKAKSSGGTDKTSWRNAHKSHVGTPPPEALDEHGNPFKYIVHIGKKWRAQIGFRIDGANRKIYSNYVESAREAAKDADVMLYKLRGTREGNFLITDDEARAIDNMNLAQVMQMVREGKNFPPPASGIVQVAAVGGGGGGGGMGVGGGEGAADGSVFFDGSARRNKPSLTSAAGQVEEGVMGQMEEGRGGGFEGIQDVEASILEGFLLGVHDNDQDGQGEGGDLEGGLMGDDGDGDGWRMSKDELMCEIVVDEGPEGLEGEGREDDSLDLMLQ